MIRWLWWLLPLSLFAVTPEQLIDAALENHPELAARQAQVQALNARSQLAGRLSNPMLELSVEDPGGNEMQMLMIGQSWPIGGRLGHERRAAKAAVRGGEESLELTRRALIAQVRRSAVDLAQAQARLDLIDRYLVLAQDLSSSAALGQRPEDHRMQLRSDTLITTLLIDQSLWQLRQVEARLSLEALSGLSVDRIDLVLQPVAIGPLQNYQARLADHPRLRQAEADYESARSALSAARASRLPDVTTRIGYTRVENMDDFITVELALPLPILGRERTQVALAQAQSANAQALLADSRLTLQRKIDLAYAAVQQQASRFGLIEERLVREAYHSYDLLYERFQTGQAGLLTLLEALGTLIEREVMLIDAGADFGRAKAILDEWAGE